LNAPLPFPALENIRGLRRNQAVNRAGDDGSGK
jgi:hypothetical protein